MSSMSVISALSFHSHLVVKCPLPIYSETVYNPIAFDMHAGSHMTPLTNHANTVTSTIKPTSSSESLEDKFSILFSPSTPRASPTLEPSLPHQPHVVMPQHHRNTSTDSDSDFGSFVSVSAMEDPLSLIDFEMPPSNSSVGMAAPSNESSGSGTGRVSEKNANFLFFDKFAHDAKAASNRSRHELLDELLMHEDDPLYWLKESGSNDRSLSPDEDRGDEITPTISTPIPESHENISPPNNPPSETVLSVNPLEELDQDFFTSKIMTPTNVASRSLHHVPSPPPHSHLVETSPSRSTTLLLPVTAAPPLADTSNASFTLDSLHEPSSFSHPLSTNFQNQDQHRPQPTHASSYSTLSTISSRFMSSLLTQKSNSTNNSTNHTSSLDTLFVPNATPPNNTSTSRIRSKIRKIRSRSIERPIPSTSTGVTLHRTISHPTPDVQISHGTPFGRTIKASPFAMHVYVPPSGAPGYKGEQYDWDRGFSDELEQEINRGKETANPEPKTDEPVKKVDKGRNRGRELVGMEQGSVGKESKREYVTHLIEKKTGGVNLTERKASTTPVLVTELANMIRCHLPALARLPRAWTLIYSLDEHGISLNTLYDRCETHMHPRFGSPGPVGALVVVKDSEGGLFGAWIGKEGIKRSAGKGYYGSGESFLWKYIGGELEVFKWTGRNDYVALCEPGFISFGGGDGNYGLYLDDTLFEGSSAPCPTFANEPLCSPGPKKAGVVTFECVGLEVWDVGP